jgi:hypothetical protein
MERLGQLEPRISVLEDDFDEDMLEAEAGNAAAAAVSSICAAHTHYLVMACHLFWLQRERK